MPATVDPDPQATCRACRGTDLDVVLSLGPQPDPDHLLDPSTADAAPEAPIDLAICAACGLAQLVGPRPAGPRPAHGHARGRAPHGDSWTAAIDAIAQSDGRMVVDLDDGLDPALDGVDLVVATHVLAHVDDPDELVAAVVAKLAPTGIVAIETHHALALAMGQFDVLSHAHRSYFSLHSLRMLLSRHGLEVASANRTDVFGGTLRVVANRVGIDPGAFDQDDQLHAILDEERAARLDAGDGYRTLSRDVERAVAGLRAYLDACRDEGRVVVGYGAASRGIALLNIAGVTAADLAFVADRSAEKQRLAIPRSRIPIVGPEEVARSRPDDILILPWPLADPIAEQLADARSWGARFVVAMPTLEIRP